MTFEHPNSEGCEEFRDDIVELALGTLTGRRRSRALDHIATCERCSDELASLSDVTDALLILSPVSEPPFGFEQRLIERYRAGANLRNRPRRQRLVLVGVAAVVLATLSFAVGSNLIARHSSPPAAVASPVTAHLTSGGQVLGQVILSAGSPSWITMSLDDPGWSGTAWCNVRLKSGRIESVGHFSVVHGYGAWSAEVHASAGQVVSANVTDDYGTVLASATLSA
ncbi:MAG TPA: zf-HC2 domain-containing protein [Acidimicrobiales bacterium]